MNMPQKQSESFLFIISKIKDSSLNLENVRVLSQVKGPVQLTNLSNIANSFLQYCLIRSVLDKKLKF